MKEKAGSDVVGKKAAGGRKHSVSKEENNNNRVVRPRSAQKVPVRSQDGLPSPSKIIKKEGAANMESNGEALEPVKSALPYDIKSLDWDDGHKQNKQQKYCYCGSSGVWYKKMLQCSRCKQWFHEACIQRPKYPLLCGDRCFIFVCSLCNCGPEYLQRLEPRWVDLVHLAVFNLTLQHIVKYYDSFDTIIPWIEKNSAKLQSSKFDTVAKVKRKEKILQVLEHNKNLFRSGREIKKRSSLYGLRICFPPPAPSFVIPASGTVVADLLVNIKESGIKTKTVSPNNSAMNISHFKRKATSQPGDFTRIVKRARKLVNQSAASQNKALGKKSKHNTVINGHKVATGANSSSANNAEHEDATTPQKLKQSPSPKKTSLESIIPRLSSYDGFNHPFKTVLERNIEIENRKMKDLVLNSYTCEDADSEAGQMDTASESAASDAASSSATTDASANANNIQEQTSGYSVHRRRRGRKTQAEIAYMEAFANIAQSTSTESALLSRVSKSSSSPSQRNNNINNNTQPKNVVDKVTLDSMKKRQVSITQLKSSVNSYFGAANRLAYGERFKVLARRINRQGKVQYLVEWEGGVIG